MCRAGRDRRHRVRQRAPRLLTSSATLAGITAAALGINDADAVRVTSRYGTAVLPAHITRRVSPGELFTTLSDPAARVNRLTGPHRDAITNTPEYKVTAVQLASLGAEGRLMT